MHEKLVKCALPSFSALWLLLSLSSSSLSKSSATVPCACLVDDLVGDFDVRLDFFGEVSRDFFFSPFRRMVKSFLHFSQRMCEGFFGVKVFPQH